MGKEVDDKSEPAPLKHLVDIKDTETKLADAVTTETEAILIECQDIADIDLSCLRNHPTLSDFRTFRPPLASIDLSPLGTCPRLESITITTSAIQEIDLSPFSKCSKLECLGLMNNDLREIDLAPLKKSKRLESLLLGGNPLLMEVDITPVFLF